MRRGPAGPGLRVVAPGAAIDRLFRHESGRAVASLIRVLGDFDLAEEAVQEAWVVALERWPRDGVPDNPGAWITTTARNRAIDRLRRARVLEEKRAQLAALEALGGEEAEPDGFPDDRLRLMFTCCHPSLAAEARVALTLRTLGGLSVAEVARAFLVAEPAMAKRLTRAKGKIASAGIAYRVPEERELPHRMPSVLAAVYLIFNEGYAATAGEALVRRELCAEAIRLGRLLVELMPGRPEPRGLLALMLLHHARRDARVDAEGRLVLLADQDRSLWHADEIAEGRAHAAAAAPDRYGLQAAIAAEHVAEVTDWAHVAALYARLAALDPSPVIELNRAVAVAMAEGPERGLALIDAIAGLDGYHLLHSARADLLRRLGRSQEARAAYERALALAVNPVEREFLERRLRDQVDELDDADQRQPDGDGQEKPEADRLAHPPHSCGM
jgi:RNA polymerase sigma-70 factor, ECF subfamily